ncbi:hypothetical protein Tco_0614944 [Tanacetum coccineum]
MDSKRAFDDTLGPKCLRLLHAQCSLNMDQLESNWTKKEFQVIGSLVLLKYRDQFRCSSAVETESKMQDYISRSGNDAHADNADIKPIYDEEPMAEDK